MSELQGNVQNVVRDELAADRSKQIAAIKEYLLSAELWSDPVRAWSVRMVMAAFGWNSHDEFTRQGWGENPGYSIWFDRWRSYTGKAHDRASFHRHVRDPYNASLATLQAALDALENYDGTSASGTSSREPKSMFDVKTGVIA